MYILEVNFFLNSKVIVIVKTKDPQKIILLNMLITDKNEVEDSIFWRFQKMELL